MISAAHLGVSYRIDLNRNTNLKEFVIHALKRQNQYRTFWALRDVSFEVMRGEVLGVIGRNGAGKSTLLKVIAGIIRPTEGSVKRRGSIVPMLELGAGFDMDLTGRENIYLNGAILGYSKAQLDRQRDAIIDFSELGDFIGMPLKTYSSGMLSRLAFSIASVIEPEVLIVDEILAVGDESFQRKSRQRMMELMSGGTTVLFVSHNIQQIREMCGRVLWLEHGQVKRCGEAGPICDEYEQSL
ncbi:MAG: ABC transporter ATP-binding protein [Clostridia bacterium]|nr:ABC transporter ATP-binding protein [Clostridia bacterium]MBR4458170.1 ABC transporter ATP-binding protein [Clostridia bacterium]